MGATTLVQPRMEVSYYKTTYNTSSEKVSIGRVEEVDFCTEFLGGATGNKICGLVKGENGSCNKYKPHAVLEKGDLYRDFYLNSNGTNMFLKHFISLTIGDENQMFILHVGEDLSKDTAMAIMNEVNRTTNTSTDEFEEAAYVGTLSKDGTKVMDELSCGDIGSPSKRLKTVAPPEIETIADTVMVKFFF